MQMKRKRGDPMKGAWGSMATKKLRGPVGRTGHFVSVQAGRQRMRTGPTAVTKFSSSAFRRGEEVKTLDIQFTGAAAAAYTADTQPAQLLNLNNGTACVQSMNLIQQGAGISQRIGNKISLKSCRLRLALLNNGTNQATTVRARVMLLYDRNPNGGYVAANSILGESLQSNTIGTGTMYSNLNPNFFDRFVVLMDDIITLPPWVSSSIATSDMTGPTTDRNFLIDRYIPLKNLECVYNGTANPMTIAFQNTGSLQILCFGDVASASVAFNLVGTARIRFMDN